MQIKELSAEKSTKYFVIFLRKTGRKELFFGFHFSLTKSLKSLTGERKPHTN